MARSILEQMDTLVTSTDSAGRGEAGRPVIGFYTSLSAGNLRATLVDYAQRLRCRHENRCPNTLPLRGRAIVTNTVLPSSIAKAPRSLACLVPDNFHLRRPPRAGTRRASPVA
jgi:hypothetical protein